MRSPNSVPLLLALGKNGCNGEAMFDRPIVRIRLDRIFAFWARDGLQPLTPVGWTWRRFCTLRLLHCKSQPGTLSDWGMMMMVALEDGRQRQSTSRPLIDPYG
jgi:hypothetical protein